MALLDISFPETDVDGFTVEIPVLSLGTITDMVFDIDEIGELILAPATGGATSWVF